MEKTFINSFTGNVVIRPKSEFSLSLFGDDTPVTGELSEIPPLVPYTEISETVSAMAEVVNVQPQISGYVAVDASEGKAWLYAFGVNAKDYLEAMPAINITDGRCFEDGEKGVMVSKGALQWIKDECELDEVNKVGDKLKLLTYDGASVTIRLVPIVGIYEYEVDNVTLDKIVLVSPEVLRELLDMTDYSDGSDIDPDNMSLLGQGGDSFFDLFNDVSDTVGVEVENQDFGEDKVVADTGTDSNAWSFLLCRTGDGVKDGSLIKKLNKIFEEKDWPCEAINWRHAAGGTVMLVFYLRLILNIGIILILLTGFIVIVNTLVVSAFSRITETGTLRAIGASRGFVMLQFLWETLFLTITSGVIGCALGLVWSCLIQAAGIHLGNELLVQLFGSSTLRTVITKTNFILCMGVSVVLSLIGWYYPMKIAVNTNPVVAIRGQA